MGPAVTYTEAAATAVAVALLCDLGVLRTRLVLMSSYWISYLIVLGFQLLVNGVLTGARIVVYNPHQIIGLRLVHAPVEDLGFGFALVLITVSWWEWLGRRGVS